MSFHIVGEERAIDGLQRILREQMSCALACVARDGRLTDEEIHNARKAIKRARATLRLLRPALPRTVFAKTNLALRDAARPLTQVRDTKVLLDSLASLRSHYGSKIDSDVAHELENRLRIQRNSVRRELTVSTPALSHLRGVLKRLNAATKRWKLRCDDWDLLSESLRRIYSKARRAHADAGEFRTDEHLHEWRKQAKHLWYALEILTPVRPGRIADLAGLAHKLADHLGDDHDLAILRQHVGASVGNDKDADALEDLIDKRRDKLQERAFAVGQRLLARKSKRFVREIESFWLKWSKPKRLDAKQAGRRPRSRRGKDRTARGLPDARTLRVPRSVAREADF